MSATLQHPAAAHRAGFKARVLPSMRDIPLTAWRRMLPDEPEGWEYYTAVENCPPSADFTLGAVAVYSDSEVVAAAPMFHATYRLDTPLQNGLRKITDKIFEFAPQLLTLRVIGLGSPVSDNLTIALQPSLNASDRILAVAAMLDALEQEAARTKAAIIAVKSIDLLADEMDPAVAGRGYTRITSVPTTMLELPYRNMDEFFAALAPKPRADLRRKYRTRSKVHFETRSSIRGLEEEIYDLFQNTLANSRVDYGEFEQVHPDYFRAVLDALGGKARLRLAWHEGRLMSFSLALVGGDCIVTKQIGMRYPEARHLNLYFLNWLDLIEFALERRIPAIDMGSTSYSPKLVFGAQLDRRWLYYRFRIGMANRLVKPLGPMFDYERNDPEIKQLSPCHFYAAGEIRH